MISQSRRSSLMLMKLRSGPEKPIAARVRSMSRHAQMDLQFTQGLDSSATIATLQGLDHIVGEFVLSKAHT